MKDKTLINWIILLLLTMICSATAALIPILLLGITQVSIMLGLVFFLSAFIIFGRILEQRVVAGIEMIEYKIKKLFRQK